MWPELLAGRSGLLAVTFPPVAWLSATTAVLTVCGPELSRRWRSGLWWLTATTAAIETIVGAFLPVDAVAAAALGVTVGCLVLLAFGEPASRPDRPGWGRAAGVRDRAEVTHGAATAAARPGQVCRDHRGGDSPGGQGLPRRTTATVTGWPGSADGYWCAIPKMTGPGRRWNQPPNTNCWPWSPPLGPGHGFPNR